MRFGGAGVAKTKRLLPAVVVLAGCVLGMACQAAVAQELSGEARERPNVVFVLADDMAAGDLTHMPTVQRELVAKGTSFENFGVSWPACCPSRATMLTGMYGHNHGISGKADAAGPAFASRGLDEDTVATRLDEAGYHTAYLGGKYLNGWREESYIPPGWDSWRANSETDVWSPCLAEQGRERCYGDENMDLVLSEKARNYVSGRAGPFFLWMSTNAPHQKNNGPPPHLKSDRDAFVGVPLPRSPSFNEEEIGDKPSWMRDNLPLDDEEIKAMAREYRARLASLQVVDRTMRRMLDRLEASGELDNTYVILTSDNGYHMGEHRMGPQKGMPYVEDVRVPLVVRGPGVAQGAVRDELVLNTDVAPTLAELGGAQAPARTDGRSFVPLLGNQSEADSPGEAWRDAVLVEADNGPWLGRPAFSGVWTVDGDWYVEYANGEKELYDLTTDHYQLENLAGTRPELEAELAARLRALEDCAGEACRAAEDGRVPGTSP